MIRLVPYKAEHEFMLVNRDGWIGANFKQCFHKESSGPAYTAMIDEKVVGCAGIMIPWPHVGLGWMVIDKAIEPYKIWFTRTIRKIIKDVSRAYQLHRIEVNILEGFSKNARWAESLGFEKEGRARWYTSDRQNVIRYEMIILGDSN